ncbi:MAG: dolichyl-phosphate beta-glucosyltransferase [Candidatus Sungiibacteriota bacterium]
MYLSWIIPAYNEEKRIEKTIHDVEAYLRAKNFTGGYEIIVSNSASRDRTADIVRDMQKQFSALRLLNLENKGKGWAVREGMRLAKGEIRIFADADNSVSPEQFDAFLPLLCRAGLEDGVCMDVVIGSIEVAGAVIEEQAQWYRRILGKLSKYVIRIGAGIWEIHDSQRGFKAFTRRAADYVFLRQTLTGWGFDFEILAIAKIGGFRIKEMPVRWINPPDSKVGIGAYGTTLIELARVRWNRMCGFYRRGAERNS